MRRDADQALWQALPTASIIAAWQCTPAALADCVDVLVRRDCAVTSANRDQLGEQDAALAAANFSRRLNQRSRRRRSLRHLDQWTLRLTAV
jgi:hypothetical protein